MQLVWPTLLHLGVQAACIPLALAGRDICGSAITGMWRSHARSNVMQKCACGDGPVTGAASKAQAQRDPCALLGGRLGQGRRRLRCPCWRGSCSGTGVIAATYALVLTPTRELAVQARYVPLCPAPSDLTACLSFGGCPFQHGPQTNDRSCKSQDFLPVLLPEK